MRRVAVVPAFEAEATVGRVVEGLGRAFDEVWVVDDGSRDATSEVARKAGARVLFHGDNRGKGAALRTAFRAALAEGLDAVVTVDADGQHPPEEAARLDQAVADRGALVVGIRDFERAGAPHTNRRGNEISNWWLTRLTGHVFVDSQCGMRRYPVAATLALGSPSDRFAFEADVLYRAFITGLPVVEVPVSVVYPQDRTTHFHLFRDPTQITCRLISTFVTGGWRTQAFVGTRARGRRRAG